MDSDSTEIHGFMPEFLGVNSDFSVALNECMSLMFGNLDACCGLQILVMEFVAHVQSFLTTPSSSNQLRRDG